MNINYLRAGVAGASALLLLTGCMDDKYDLSDIDTTTQLKVNDLVIPVNIASLTLDNVMDIDENDPDATIKYVEVGGKKYFAIEKSGDFHASPTKVEEVVADKPSDIEPIEQDLTGEPVVTTGMPRKAPGTSMKYQINEDKTDFTYDMKDVDEAIESVEVIKMQREKLLINVELVSPDVLQTADFVEFSDLDIKLPMGMTAVCKDGTQEDNILHVPYLKGTGNRATLLIEADAIDLTEQYGPNGIEVKDSNFKYASEIGVVKGDLTVHPKSLSTEIPGSIHFTMTYDLSGFIISEFDGRINYKAEIDNIDPVELSDLPDFLAGEETNLIMNNPQIVLTVNNPLWANQVGCKSGLTISSLREDGSVKTESMAEPFSIGYDKKEGPYTIVVAPRPDDAINVTGTNRSNYEFPGLRNILAGNGLPQKLEIQLSNNSMPDPRVQGNAINFQLGKELGEINGEYVFTTLLALDDGSKIVYETTEDGWNDEDVDAIDISHFTVNASANTNLPCAVTLTMRPLDTEGKEIAITNPEDAKTIIPAYAENVPVNITLAGDIRHLDGIRIIAIVNDFNGDTMMPDQNIELKDVRVKVTGTYTKEL